MKQYKLYIMESTTGIILNIDFTYHLKSSGTKPYEEFKDKKEAIEFVNSIDKPNICFELFNDLNELVFEKFNPPIEVPSERFKTKWWYFWKKN